LTVRIINADVMEGLRQLPDESVHCVVTSPPYWGLRDYGVEGQIGLEGTPDLFVARIVEVFREVRRVLRGNGICWVNLGDSYAGSWGAQSRANPGAQGASTLQGGSMLSASQILAHPKETQTGSLKNTPGLKAKDLVGIPWRVALALQSDGWWLRQDIIWHKPNPMPESIQDRCTKAHEYIFLLTKSERYYYDADAVRTPFSGETKTQSFDTMNYKARDRYKAPDGWDTGKGGHGTIHRKGREKGALAPVDYVPPDGANRRSVWTIATEAYPDAHFATFPPELPELCIKAGTSQKGCCSACGAPWGREVERTAMVIDRSERTQKGRSRSSGTMVEPPTSKTLGWKPTCACDAAVVPCTVLDPFGGAGTTGLVADRLQRNAILIELNPEYAAMAEKRIGNDRGGLLDVMEAAQ
jgi:DNA modification methylase